MITQYPAFISQNNISTLHSVTIGITNGRQNPAFQREQSSLHGKAPELLQNGHQKTHKKLQTVVRLTAVISPLANSQTWKSDKLSRKSTKANTISTLLLLSF